MKTTSEKQEISSRIKSARLSAKISSVYVSKEMHLSDSICSQWERGISNPSTAHLVKLASILKVSFEWLATGEEKIIVEKHSTTAQQNNTLKLQINQLLDKTTQKQKAYLLGLLKDIVR